MDVKLIEIRDRGTFIAAMATALYSRNDAELFLLKRAGYDIDQIVKDWQKLDGTPSEHEPYIILTKLDGVEAQYDSFAWPNQRTLGNAHRELIAHWGNYQSGSVLDVEFVLGEVKAPKVSEARW